MSTVQDVIQVFQHLLIQNLVVIQQEGCRHSFAPCGHQECLHVCLPVLVQLVVLYDFDLEEGLAHHEVRESADRPFASTSHAHEETVASG